MHRERLFILSKKLKFSLLSMSIMLLSYYTPKRQQHRILYMGRDFWVNFGTTKCPAEDEYENYTE